jgi:hypothetical protein
MVFDLGLFRVQDTRMGDVVDRIRIVCSWCGSDNVLRDAWASWDVDKQDWVLGAVFDAGFCQACECERSLDEAGFGMLSWGEAIEAAVRRQAARSDDGSFTRVALIEDELDQIIADTGSKGATPHYTLSRELQQLRDAGRIEFLDERGGYRWIG